MEIVAKQGYIMKISLAAARVNAGLTQKEAAKRLGISNTTLNRWERGEASPRIADCQRISELYGIPYDCISFCE